MIEIAPDADRERPDCQDYVNQFPSYLRLWHKESGGVSTLCEMDRSAASSLLGIANGKLHMFGGSGTEIYAYDLAAGTFGKSDLPEEANRIWSEKYAGVKWQGYYDLETGTYYTNEYDTMQLPAGIDEFGAAPVGFGQQGIVVKEYYSKDHRGVFNNYVFFPFEKMDDGIQLTDRIIFMRESGEGSQILQPEHHAASCAAGRQPCQQTGPQVAQMHPSAGAGSKAANNLFVHGHLPKHETRRPLYGGGFY